MAADGRRQLRRGLCVAVALLLAASSCPAAAEEVLQLHTLPWALSNEPAGFGNASLEVRPPTAALQALQAAGIGDPLWR